MKKKLFPSFIVSLFVFTLFISVSKAEFSETVGVYSATFSSTSSVVKTTEYAGYSLTDIYNLVYNYNNNGFESSAVASDYNLMLEALRTNGYSFFNYCTGTNFILGNLSDIGVNNLSADGTYERLFLYFNVGDWYLYNSGFSFYRKEATGAGYLLLNTTVYDDIEHKHMNCPCKKLTSDIPVFWTGEYLSYYPASIEPEIPDFEGISDDEKALIINSVVNLDDFKNIVPKKYRNQYFIVYEPSIQRFKVYFYPEQYYLKGRRFAEGEVDDISYESYKIIAFDSTNFIWDLWQSINPFDYYVFSGFLEEDDVFAPQFYGYENSHDLNQYYFSVYDEPIVYSSRDIGFLIYDITNNEYSDDAENSIITAPLVDSSGEEITITIPEEEGPESIGFWNSLIEKVIAPIKEFLTTFKEANNIGLRFSSFLRMEEFQSTGVYILFLMLDVFLASFSLITRFAVFVFTLPSIEATSSLLPDAVVQGLDWFKALNWNGLSFWVLFESFVLAIFAVFIVRLVRRFYRL